MTAPDAIITENTIRSYSIVMGHQPLHSENNATFFHLFMFSGGAISADPQVLRAVYPYIASAFVPLLGWFPSLLFTNVISWITGIAIVYAFCIIVTKHSSAAFLGCLFSVGGMGFVAHIHDYSAHLMAFTFYFGAVLLLYISGVWAAPQKWSTHAALGCFLTLASLQYNTGLAALLGYALVSVRHNSILKIGTICATVYACFMLWPRLLNWLSGAGIDYGAFEREYSQLTISAWTNLLQDPLAFLNTYGTVILDSLSFEMPFLIAFGLIGIAIFLRDRRSIDLTIFVSGFFIIPILTLGPYAGVSGVARGYITYQTSIFIYMGAGYLLWRVARIGGRGQLIAAMLGSSLLVMELAWNLAYLAGLIGPIKIYFLGISHYWPGVGQVFAQLLHIPTVISLTGAEPTPTLFFGNSTLIDGGLASCDGVVETATLSGFVWRALAVRAPFILLTAGVILIPLRKDPLQVGVRRMWSVYAGSAFALFLGVAALLSYPLRSREFPSICAPGTPISASTIRYEVDFAPEALTRLEALPPEITKLEVVHGFRYSGLRDPSVHAELVGDALRIELPITEYAHIIERHAIVQALQRNPRLTLEVTHSSGDPILMDGWQRNGLLGRRLNIDGRTMDVEQQRVLPAFEIRARQPAAKFMPDLVLF